MEGELVEEIFGLGFLRVWGLRVWGFEEGLGVVEYEGLVGLEEGFGVGGLEASLGGV